MVRKKLLKSEVVKLFNTTKETLRYYENKGLLSPEIDENNYRLYDYKDLQKLREIFLLRDLGLPIEEMKRLDDMKVDKSEYMSSLKSQNAELKEKIIKLQNVSKNIDQLLDILEHDNDNKSYQVRYEAKRFFYVFDYIDEDIIESPKRYYDVHYNLIEKSSYSEKVLQLTFGYDDLKNNDFKNAKMCMELSQNDHMIIDEKYKDNIMSLETGKYLSIFYPYTQGELSKFSSFTNEIELFLKENNLKLISNVVIEKEHPELSTFLDEGRTMFEIQIFVK